MAILREQQGNAYIQPQRPFGMGSAIPKLAANSVLGIRQHAVSMVARAHLIAVNAKGGSDMVQWIFQDIMEVEPDLARSCLNAANAFGDMAPPCIRAALEVNPTLHPLTPLYDVLYTRGNSQLWVYDGLGDFIICVFCSRGVR